MQPGFDHPIDLIRNAGAVKRYHTVDTLRQQTVAEHSWGVAMILLTCVPFPSRELVSQALYHDMAEVLTGDVPATAKWNWPEFASAEQRSADDFHRQYGYQEHLQPWEFELLKLADGLEGFSFCLREVELGNRLMLVVGRRWEAHLRKKFNMLSTEATAMNRADKLKDLYMHLCRMISTYEEVMV